MRLIKMKFVTTTTIAGIALAITPVTLLADNVTIPNTFQSGTQARAAEVNANFAAVEASIDDNAVGVGGNAQAIQTVSLDTSMNTQSIDAVTQSVNSILAPVGTQFIGISTGTTNGSAGLFGMNEVCQADFGPGARMASTQDVADSASGVVVGAAAAWVRPILKAVDSISTSAQNAWVIDYSGFVNSTPDMTCSGWNANSSSLRGLTLLPNGALTTLNCDRMQRVACAVPQ